METCDQVLLCEEVGRAMMLMATINLVQQWLAEAGMDPDLLHCMVRYESSNMMEGTCHGRPRLREMTKAQVSLAGRGLWEEWLLLNWLWYRGVPTVRWRGDDD